MTTEFDLPSIGSEGDGSRWNEQLARNIASADGIGPLGEAHWRVIRYLRQHFVQYGAAPPMHVACVQNNLDPHCVDKLFHGAREAWRVAGLPDPGSEAISYMD